MYDFHRENQSNNFSHALFSIWLVYCNICFTRDNQALTILIYNIFINITYVIYMYTYIENQSTEKNIFYMNKFF